MKAVIYARYSSDSQREESIEGQLRECAAFAEKNGITVLRHYIDRAYSAKTDNCPEFQSMIKDSGKRLFDIVIVWKLDRFARNRYDSARYKATLKKNGVKVVSATEIISEGAEGIILESVLEGYAEYYSADLSEKVVRGMTDNALKCKFNGGMMPIGYVIDAEQHFQIDPLTAPFVLEAFKRYDGGETISSIMNWLNEQGLTNTRGRKMTFNSVGHILHNRRYIGEFRYRDVIVPDGIPAIVPQDLFDRVQEKLAKNKKAPARHKAEDDYLLTTKLFCGYCGAYLCGESGTSRTGKVHHYYKCVSVKKKRTECHKRPVRKEWIEDLVVGETMKMVMDDKAIEAIVSMLMDLQDRDNVNVPLYEQQLREADTAISNLLNAIQQGILTRATKARLEELENRRDELENRLACEKLAKPKVSAEFMTFWLHRFRKLDVRQQSHRKMLIDTFINAIFLYDDKMVITFNYKEGTKTSTFAELQEAISDKNGSDLDCLAAPRRSTPFGGLLFVSKNTIKRKSNSSTSLFFLDHTMKICYDSTVISNIGRAEQMELRNITTFLRVAELQNFTHAAQELGYSQSAVTVQIRQLETELGVPLFERIGRSVSLTAPGQAFLQQAGEIIKAAERARDAVRTAPEPEGTLRLGTMESLGASVVWRLIAGFHRQFPRVNVVVRTSTADGLLEMMRRNDVDFIYFVDEKQYSPDWEIPLCRPEETVFVTAPHSQLAARGEPIPLRELVTYPCVLTEAGESYRIPFERLLAEHDLVVAPILEIGSTEIVARMVRENVGYSVLPMYVASEYLKSGELVPFRVPEFKSNMYQHIIYHKNKWLTPQMKGFMQLIIDHVEHEQ